jgi:hypothetical protein
MQVLAAGRYRYRYGDDGVDDLPAETWLVRLWPDHDERDAMSGPARRLPGPLPFAHPNSAWFSAVNGWRTQGWSHYFLGVEAFRNLEVALLLSGRPVVADELMSRLARMFPQDALDWTSPVLGRMANAPVGLLDRQESLAALAAAADLPALVTYADALACLLRLGLLARCQSGELVPNPVPTPAWTALRLSDARVLELRMQALASEYSHLEPDLEHVVRWAPDDGLVTTPERIAVRLALPTDDVIATIRLLVLRGTCTVSPDLEQVGAMTVVRLTRT